MKEIKLWDGIRVTTETKSEVFETPNDLWDAINWHDEESQVEIMKELYCFGKIDLTECYHGHTVILTVYKKEE